LTSTKILFAIPLPIASLEPLTQTSKGPLKGADFTIFTLVPGVKPKSVSLLINRAGVKRILHAFLALCLHIDCLFVMSVVVIIPVSPLRNAVSGNSISLTRLHFS
jgi:hypothetical protein